MKEFHATLQSLRRDIRHFKRTPDTAMSDEKLICFGDVVTLKARTGLDGVDSKVGFLPSRGQLLLAIPPTQAKASERFEEAEFVVTAVDEETHFNGTPLDYDQAFTLQTSDEKSLSTKTPFHHDSISLQKVSTKGEMQFSISKMGAASGMHVSNGDRGLQFSVHDSSRMRTKFNHPVSLVDKKRGKVTSSYLCSTGKGEVVDFTMTKIQGKVETRHYRRESIGFALPMSLSSSMSKSDEVKTPERVEDLDDTTVPSSTKLNEDDEAGDKDIHASIERAEGNKDSKNLVYQDEGTDSHGDDEDTTNEERVKDPDNSMPPNSASGNENDEAGKTVERDAPPQRVEGEKDAEAPGCQDTKNDHEDAEASEDQERENTKGKTEEEDQADKNRQLDLLYSRNSCSDVFSEDAEIYSTSDELFHDDAENAEAKSKSAPPAISKSKTDAKNEQEQNPTFSRAFSGPLVDPVAVDRLTSKVLEDMQRERTIPTLSMTLPVERPLATPLPQPQRENKALTMRNDEKEPTCSLCTVM